jgi:arylsulfatase A-like enzyme
MKCIYRAALVIVTLLQTVGCVFRTQEPIGILLISVDTLRADRLNCYGYARRRTSPAIDALARDGVLFENHIATSPWTLPSHISLLTSECATRHGVVVSLSDVMAAQQGTRPFPRLSDDQWTLAEALAGAGYENAAFTGGGALDPQLGLDQGFPLYDTSMFKLSPQRMAPLYAWIKEHGPRRFFLFWHNYEVHAPYVGTDFLAEEAPRDSAAILKKRLDRRAALLRMDRSAFSNQDIKRMLASFDAYSNDVCSALYDGGIHSFDRYLEQLISFLRANHLYDRTLIVLTSDHGEEFDERGNGFYNKHGHTLYEELLRVPLIIKLPRQAHAGERVKAVTSALDVMPTLLELTGTKARPNTMEGVSLRPMWESRGTQTGRLVISEALAFGPEQKSIRSDREKLIVAIDPAVTTAQGRQAFPEALTRRQLFDLANDPGERNDLLGAGLPNGSPARRAALLETELRRALAGGKTRRPESTTLDAEAQERLRALGYVE